MYSAHRCGIAPTTVFRAIFGAFLFLFSLAAGASHFHFSETCRQAYTAVLDLRFAEAGRLLAIERKADPANLVPVYVENLRDFLVLAIGEERSDYDRLKSMREKRMKILETGDPESPWYAFSLGEVSLQWAVARLKFGDYAGAALDLRRAGRYLRENRLKHPAFLPGRTGLGVVRVMAGLVPPKYRWAGQLAGLDGSVEEGISDIRAVASYDGPDPVVRMFRTQAVFFLAFLELNVVRDRKTALALLPELRAAGDGLAGAASPLLVYASASILMRNGRNDEALQVLSGRTTLPGQYPFHYLDYLEGLARLQSLDLSAAACFDRYIDRFRGVNYTRAARQRLAWIRLLQGDEPGYRQLMAGMDPLVSGLTDEDRQACLEARDKRAPGLVLLRARLLFDGGYYGQALDQLLNHPVAATVGSRRDLLEYSYRLGRIYHETGLRDRAEACYLQTIERGRNESWYFAAGAAYQLGLMRESAGDTAGAAAAYRVCLSIEPEEYKTSLHQKAKAGLSRLHEKGVKT